MDFKYDNKVDNNLSLFINININTYITYLLISQYFFFILDLLKRVSSAID